MEKHWVAPLFESYFWWASYLNISKHRSMVWLSESEKDLSEYAN